MRAFTALLVCSTLLLGACASDDPPTASDGTATEDTETEAGDTSNSNPDGDESESDSGEDEPTDTGEPEPPPFEPIPARGITIPRVEINQGVTIPVVEDGVWVDGLGRTAPILQNRTTLIRAGWELAPDFEPREIEARLTLGFSDGTTEVANKVVLVDSTSQPGDLDSSFWWMLPPELALPGTKLQIELLETDFGQEDTPEPDPPPLAPVDGMGYLGFEDSYQVFRVTIVPVEHDIGGNCAPAPVVNEDVVEVYRQHLFHLYPVELVEISVREPTVFTGSLTTSFNPVLDHLAQLRSTDNADPGRYYYGVIRTCDGGPDGVGGQAIDIPDAPTKGNAWTRVAVGRWWGKDGANMIVHELGHTQGRRHVNCNGEEAWPDPRYPYEGGTIGVWGFGVDDWSWHPPTSATDYMSYCAEDDWSSDWGWNEIYPFIHEVSSWELESGQGSEPKGMLLIGSLPPDGTSNWFVVPGDMADRAPTPGHALEIVLQSGIERRRVSIRRRPDSDTYNVVVEVPPTLPLARSITWLAGDQRTTIDTSTISFAAAAQL